jgi:hypothetical protein
MSNTASTPSRDAAEGSHLTVEDAGSTTDASDLFQNDTTADGTSSGSRRTDGDDAASAAVTDAGAASGPGSQADPSSASSRGASTAAGSGSDRGSNTAAHAVSAGSTDSSAASASSPSSTSTASDRSTASTTSSADEQPHGLAALAGDDSIAHVFDQTNGVIEGIDGDSDGSADSDLHSREERADENPAFENFADSEVQGDGGTDDPRRIGS